MMTRTNIFASIRFVMIFYIVQGHFLQVATTNPLWLALFKQHNAVVGCFFLLSGFLLAQGFRPEAEPLSWWASLKMRLSRVYPVYATVLVLFLPMFLAVDVHYGATFIHEVERALICALLLQAWHPDWGLLWNAPTWFLSSLAFCYACFPLVMPRAHRLTTRTIGGVIVFIFLILAAVKIAYSVKNGFFFLEGLVEPKPIPYFNFVRFFPAINALEFFLGMLVGILAKRATPSHNAATYMPVMMLMGLVALLFGRTIMPMNDMLARTFVLTPLFLMFLYYAQRGQGRYLGIFERPWFRFLGDISFSLYCIHGALGQLFYKKAVKTMLGMPEVPYTVYLGLLFISATALYYGVEQRFLSLPARQKKSRLTKEAAAA